MKSNDIRELQTKELAELQQQLRELETKLVKVRLERSAGKLDNPAQVKMLTNDVARVKTVLRAKELTQKVSTKA
ncbi:MAG: 50S ribosomal protein L29 [Candidatus Pacebacteria bacterium CG_4_10_14_0_8_um_filter_43_12]|nr:MAG: 50S ribosomal protein L29 [Candidatus Pacebacteria bacterium CG10_big_fil_rev_8_21_14_0_10_44_11]PIY79550.1 MAG: 50S ribosomal protein L29 [Candidatus Pacebacteria bacterium CG_4_10_14_0_8_um_filter_43_12]